MDPTGRVLAALDHGVPDRIPVHAVAIDGSMVDEVLGAPSRTAFDVMAVMQQEDPVGWASRFSEMIGELESSVFGRMLEAAARLGFDACGCGYIPLRVESMNRMTDVFGRVYRIVNNKGNIFPLYLDGMIKTRHDWEAWPPIDVKGTCRKAKRLYSSVKRRVKDAILVIAQDDYSSVFPPAWQGMGMPAFSRALRKDPRLVEERLATNTELVIALFKAYHEAGARVFFEGGDIAFKGGPLISPKHVDKFVKPCFQRLTREVHSWSGDPKIIFHSDGDVTPLLDFVVEAGFDALHCLEPPHVDPVLVKQRIGDKLCLLGNIDTSHVLVDGSRAEVEGAVQAAISTMGHGGGFILSPTNDHPGISLQRVRWMIDAARRFGTGPLETMDNGHGRGAPCNRD